MGHSLGGAVALRCARVVARARRGRHAGGQRGARLDVPEEVMQRLRTELPEGDESPVEPCRLRSLTLAFSPATHRDVRSPLASRPDASAHAR
jgi:hypothetical protein